MVETGPLAGHQVVFTGRNEPLIEAIAAKTARMALSRRRGHRRQRQNLRRVHEAHGRRGRAVNNAASDYRAEIGDLDVDRMKALFDTNVFGLVDITNRVVPQMKARGQGDIVNIASTTA